jgi:hypothetical protein
MEVSLSKGAVWAAIAAILAISLMIFRQFAAALAVAAMGGVGFYFAKYLENVLERQEPWNR